MKHYLAVPCLVCALCVAGCASSPPVRTDITVIAPAATQNLVTAGQSRADVMAALGQTKVLYFDSGYEVWVYYYGDAGHQSQPTRADGRAEFLVLFSPSGQVLKTRNRPAPPPDPKDGV